MSEHGNLREFYDSKYRGEEWALAVLKPHAVSTTRYDDTARLLASESGELLEIGCGSGKFTMAIAPQFEKVIGLDLSPVRIETARRMLKAHCPHLDGRVEFVVGDGDGPLAFLTGSFDVVVLCAVLEHVVDVFGLLDEAARVCKRGGVVVISVPNLAYLKHVLDLIRGRHPLTGIHARDIATWRELGWDGAHLHYFTQDSLGEALKSAGLIPEVWTGDGRWARFRRWRTNWVGGLTVMARKP